jgi:hypothetical protein
MSNLLEQASLVLIPSGYKEDVVYSEIPLDGSGDLQLTRASNGTRVNSAGLVEVVPWNFLEQSENFADASWGKTTITLTSGITAPNGTATAYTVANTAASGIIQKAVTLAGLRSVSIYAKQGTHRYLYMGAYGGTSSYANFDLQNGVVSSGTNAQIESVGNGWYRCVSHSADGSTGGVQIFPSNNASGPATTNGSIYLWGAQLNIGSTAKPYFPTTDRLNVPRLTYQNGGGGCPSLLLEKQSTNIVKYSQDISNTSGSYWGDGSSGGTATVTANYATSPDGTSNATRVQINQGSGYALWQQILSVTSGASYTYSIWLKSLSGTPTIVWLYDGAANQNITITSEWVRYTFSYTAASTNTFPRFAVWSSAWGTSSSADILAWGAQLEQSSYPTSYIPTTSASATRVADACFKTGISSLIGQTEGTLFADVIYNGSANTGEFNRIINITDGSSSNFISVSKNNTTDELYVYCQTSAGVQVNSGAIAGTSLIGRHKIALAYKSNDFTLFVDGVQKFTDTSASVPTCNRLNIGSLENFFTSTEQLGGSVGETILFPTRLTNAELASLTTL